MKTNLISLMMGFLLLITAPLGMVVGAWGWHGQRAQDKNEYRLEGPFTQDNLSVFLIHGKDKITGKTFLTLQEALPQSQPVRKVKSGVRSQWPRTNSAQTSADG